MALKTDNKKFVKGFTLVEIIVVLVILAVLAAATIPSVLGFIDDAKLKTIDNEARVVRNAAQAYATEQSAKGETDTDIENKINGVINSNHALHNLLQNDANGMVFKTEVKNGKIKKFNYTKEIIDQNEDFISDKVRYVVFDDEKTSFLHATDPITNINIDNFKAKIIEEITASLTSDQPSSLKSSLTTDLNSSLESGMTSKIAALKTNFRTELGSNVVDLIYPVGSYYVSNSSTSPATLFGGTWTQITDRFLWCVGANAGTTGGSLTHTHATKPHALSLEEIPGHVHSYSRYVRVSWVNNGVAVPCTSTEGSSEGTQRSNSQGGSLEHSHGDTLSASNMPPYMAVYCWKRTA